MHATMICITTFDKERLGHVLRSNHWRACRDKQHLLTLEERLAQARVVAPEFMPDDVVTMGSRVRVQDLDSGKERVLTLAFPIEADSAQGKISVLAHIGTTLLGHRAGDVVTWRSAGETRRLKIHNVLYQPEAAGDLYKVRGPVPTYWTAP